MRWLDTLIKLDTFVYRPLIRPVIRMKLGI